MTNEDDDGPNASDIWPPVGEKFRFHRIREEELLEMLVRLDINKAMRMDKISAKVFHYAAQGI